MEVSLIPLILLIIIGIIIFSPLILIGGTILFVMLVIISPIIAILSIFGLCFVGTLCLCGVSVSPNIIAVLFSLTLSSMLLCVIYYSKK